MGVSKTCLLIFGLILCAMLLSFLYNQNSYIDTLYSCVAAKDLKILKEKNRLRNTQTGNLKIGGFSKREKERTTEPFLPRGLLTRGEKPYTNIRDLSTDTRFPPERTF